MSQLQQLKRAQTKHHLAAILGYKTSALTYILYKIPKNKKYFSFTIPKKSGGVRIIDAPTEKLKLLQKRLATLLQNCYTEIQSNNSKNNTKGVISHGFVKKSSIELNAQLHIKKRYVFNFDLKDFFGTINFGRVQGYFTNSRDFSLNSEIATVIAQIACFNNKLPQGSPSSPIISALIGNILDSHLVRLAKKNGAQYSRYADDITFSTNRITFPKAIAHQTAQGSWVIGSGTHRILTNSGFRVNPTKTRMQYRTSRQTVTGLVVNRKPNIPSCYRKNVRAMVHNLCTKGQFHIDGKPGAPNQLHGMLAHIRRIDLYNLHCPKNSKKLPFSKELAFLDFLLYKKFFSANKPTIITEGVTDNIYIEKALNILADKFPSLIEKENEPNINILRYEKRNKTNRRILKLINGGSGNLGNFMEIYSNRYKKYKTSLSEHPLVFLVDNDSGSAQNRGVFKIAEDITGNRVKINRNDPFTHVLGNIYIIPTPLLGKENTEIEDLFSEKILSTKIDGKHFDRKGNRSSKGYSKTIFARRVVNRSVSKEDFTYFPLLFENLVKAMAHFEAIKTKT